MPRYEFTITIIGQGENVDEGWKDAVDVLSTERKHLPKGWGEYKRLEDEEE